MGVFSKLLVTDQMKKAVLGSILVKVKQNDRKMLVIVACNGQ